MPDRTLPMQRSCNMLVMRWVRTVLGSKHRGVPGGSAQVRSGDGLEPYILVSRGNDFADTFDPLFFAKTFPTLFPFGRGGPRQAEEITADLARADGNEVAAADAEVAARNLVSSRNMS